MPPVAALAGAVTAGTAAISALTITEGLMLAGTAFNLLGSATGSKALSSIGTGMTIAGGVTGIAKGINAAKTTISGTNASTTKLLDVDQMDNILGETTKGAKTIDNMKTFEPAGVMKSSTDSFSKSAGTIGQGVDAGMGSVVNEQSWLQRAGNTLMQPNTTANVLMGMGNAYMQTRGIQAQEDINDKRLGFDREQVERVNNNFAAPTVQAAMPNVRRNSVHTVPLLRR